MRSHAAQPSTFRPLCSHGTAYALGEEGDNFYVLDSGTAAVKVKDVVVATLRPGQAFGELALMYSAPRAATVTAADACRCWAMDRRSFRRLLIARGALFSPLVGPPAAWAPFQ